MWVTPKAKLLQGYVWLVAPKNAEAAKGDPEITNDDVVASYFLSEFSDGSFLILTDACETRPEASDGWYVIPYIIDDDISWDDGARACRLIQVFDTHELEDDEGGQISMALFGWVEK